MRTEEPFYALCQSVGRPCDSYYLQVMFSSKSRVLRKLPCGAGVRDTRQLPYTSFLRFDMGGQRRLPTLRRLTILRCISCHEV